MTLDNIKTYFSGLCSDYSAATVTFYHGDHIEIINRQEHDMTYPALWLETPPMKWIDPLQAVRDVSINFIQGADPQDEDDVLSARTTTEAIALAFIGRIMKDSREGTITLTDMPMLMPIHTLNMNTEYGWRVEFSIAHYRDCYVPANWEPIP